MSGFGFLLEEPDSPLLAMKWAQAEVKSSSYELTVWTFVLQLSFSLPLVTPVAHDLWGCLKAPLSPEFLQVKVRLSKFSEPARCLPVPFGIKFPKAKVTQKIILWSWKKFWWWIYNLSYCGHFVYIRKYHNISRSLLEFGSWKFICIYFLLEGDSPYLPRALCLLTLLLSSLPAHSGTCF